MSEKPRKRRLMKVHVHGKEVDVERAAEITGLTVGAIYQRVRRRQSLNTRPRYGCDFVGLKAQKAKRAKAMAKAEVFLVNCSVATSDLVCIRHAILNAWRDGFEHGERFR